MLSLMLLSLSILPVIGLQDYEPTPSSELWTSYVIRSYGVIQRAIQGTFICFDKEVYNWTEIQLATDLANMAQVDMNILVIQYSIRINEDGNSHSIYPSSLFTKDPNIQINDPIDVILTRSEEIGIHVFIGLGMILNQTGSYHPTWEIGFQTEIANELWNKYGNHSSFYGWYIPDEYENNIWWKENNATGYLSQVAGYLKNISHNKPVMISPYFGDPSYKPGYLSPSDTQKWWTNVLADAQIDIVATQDGIGCDRNITFEKVRQYYSAIQNACESNGVDHWANIEIFNISNWEPADIARIKEQIEVGDQYSTKIICYEFAHYMDPQMGNKQKELYENYKLHLSE